MARSLEPLEQLGREVANALQAAAPDRLRALEEARRAFLLHEVDSHTPATRLRSVPWLCAGGISLAALATLLLTQRGAALTFDVDGTPGVTKTWLAAPQVVPLRLTFSEGTTVRLESASRARVVELDGHGASLSLESGRLHAEVVHRSDATWKVVAGPFTVAVTGTVFDVDWDPTSEQLAVSVERGSVAVRESNTGAERAVHAAETLRTSPKHDFEVSVAEPSREPPAASANAGASAALAVDGSSRAGTVGDESPEPPPAKDETTRFGQWREFAKRGALREAYASAEAAGFTASCAGASAAELLLLGDGARLSGKPERAALALLTLRRRFPGDPRRAAAAFLLGKVAFDQRAAYEQAAEWFSTSLREQPNGPLSREASGRLIEAMSRADDSAGARRAARDYLGKYPEGPHADLARSVLH
jgi:transmembrane sensor